MKIKNYASGGNSGSGMEEKPSGPAPSRRRRPPSAEQTVRPASSRKERGLTRAARPASRLPDDGDGMGQARPRPALTRQ
jgi:hypothetical protein